MFGTKRDMCGLFNTRFDDTIPYMQVPITKLSIVTSAFGFFLCLLFCQMNTMGTLHLFVI